jgi:hypothetical protein
VRAGRWVLSIAFGAFATGAIQAQEEGQAVIRQVAGQHLYLDLAQPSALQAADTLSLEDGAATEHLLLVVAGDSMRAVVTFAGEPFPLTRGSTITFMVRRGPGTGPSPAVAAAVPAATLTRTAPRRPVRLNGRVRLSVDGLQTRTTGLGSDPEVIERDFATPVAALRLQATQLPGGLEFNANVRASHRYATDNLVRPETLVRIYQLSLAKSFNAIPLSFRLGRFYNPYEYFSGYWDGGLLYFGRSNIGGGVVAGFEPKLANDGFQSSHPKATVFLQARGRSRSVGYRTDLSFNTVFAQDTTPAHNFVGWALDTYFGRTSFSTSLQVDDNPDGDKPIVTRLLGRLSVPAGRHLILRGNLSRRQPYQLGPATDILPYRRDRAGGGVTVMTSGLSMTADVTWNQQEGLSSLMSYAGGLFVPRTVADIRLSLSGSYWSDGGDTGGAGEKGLALSGRLSRHFGKLDTGFGYQYYTSEILGREDVSHLLDLNLTVPLSRSTRASIRARTRQGDRLSSGGVFASIWWAF